MYLAFIKRLFCFTNAHILFRSEIMFKGRSQIFWFVMGGLLLVLAGVFALSGVTYPYALPILLLAAGAIIIVASLLRFRITLPSITIFLLGIVILGLVLSGYPSLERVSTETYELMTAQATVDQIELSCIISTGSIHLSFTTNTSLIYRVVFKKYYFWFTQPTVLFNKSLVDEKLTVNAESTTASVDIILSETIRSSFNLTTTTGSVRIEAPPSASKIRDMHLKTTTGEVWANITNTASLRKVVATTSTGKAELLINSGLLSHDCTVYLSTTTGQVILNLQLKSVESDLSASTIVGRVNADNVVGFTILEKTATTFHARTPNYNVPQTRKLNVSANTSTGNVDITAHYAYIIS